MEPSKKNTPGPLIIGGICVIALVVIFYLALTIFFPDLFHNMNTGDVQPIK